MKFSKDTQEFIVLAKDIARGVNASVWGGVEGAEKAATIVKTGISGTDTIVGVSHAMEDLACQDYICFTLDVVGSTASATGMVLGNIPGTKKFTVVTGSITCVCRGVRYICKRYGLSWSCHVATIYTIKGAKKGVKIIRHYMC